MKEMLMNNEMKTKTFEIDCEVFIIPNTSCTVDSFCGDCYKEQFKNVCKINGLNYETEKAVEVWLHNQDSENIVRHGIKVKDADGNDFRFNSWEIPENVPAGLLKGKKEGDVVTFKIKTVREEENLIMNITINAKLNQLNYRYRRFGKFEDALKYVLN